MNFILLLIEILLCGLICHFFDNFFVHFTAAKVGFVNENCQKSYIAINANKNSFKI